MNPPAKKITIPQILLKMKERKPLTMLTAYDASFARIVDQSGVDMILVGDSLGMVMQGHANTLPVTLEEVLYHTQCVTRAVRRAHVTADMPFMSYQTSKEEALRNAGRLIKEGKTEAVKMEGGEELAETVVAMVRAGIPVMGHIGLQPQQVHHFGYKVRGKNKREADTLLKQAKILEEAGCFALVLEGVALETARQITESLAIPTIGIGSGPHCRGQVQVLHDLLGLNPDFKPRHAKAYASLFDAAQNAIQGYISEVDQGLFPSEKHAVHCDLRPLAVVREGP